MLRASQKGRARPAQPSSIRCRPGITFALTEKTATDKIPDYHDGLWPGRFQETEPSSRTTSRCSARTGPAADIAIQHVAKETRRLRQVERQEDFRCSFTTAPYGKGADPDAAGCWHRSTAFEFTPIPVTHPRCRTESPQWALDPPRTGRTMSWFWGWGRHERYGSQGKRQLLPIPRDRMIGVWWSGAEPDVTPAGDQAVGYKSLMLQHGAGPNSPCMPTSRSTSYAKGKGLSEPGKVGESSL